MIEWLIWGLIAAAVFDAILDWSTVHGWVKERLTSRTDYAKLVQEKLASGKIRVRAGVFSAHGRLQQEQCWETDKMDEELQRRFRNSSEVRITL